MTKEQDFWNDENQPKSNWFAFDKVGAKVRGIVLDIFDKPSKDKSMPDQKVFVIRCEESTGGHAAGEMVNVGIKKTSDYLMGRTYSVKVGDRLGFFFVKEIPASKKGYNPAKSIAVYHIKDADADLVATRKGAEFADSVGM